ncbi:unnamed protein product [Adineta steineri]|uniref:G-protein coupled receptors family 1 profile domain-containing protein n=1 Tax=Adineta steineri TaxID=433720 RepID=A0A814Q7T9_9BILA|nr:unnamed protein product [Adineta steineri]
MDQWLNACVAMERAVTIIKGVQFDKKKSKELAKKVLIILLILNILTLIHDPIYRQLYQEENDNDDNKRRIWCIVNYSSNLQIYDRAINTFHFFVPFLINLISSVTLIVKKSDQKRHLQKNQPYKNVLYRQIREHKHLLIAPVVLFFLALPRLILTYVFKCMSSTKDSWLFLLGYFISFIPSMIIFIIFVLPSDFYRKEYQKTIVQYKNQILQCFRRTL